MPHIDYVIKEKKLGPKHADFLERFMVIGGETYDRSDVLRKPGITRDLIHVGLLQFSSPHERLVLADPEFAWKVIHRIRQKQGKEK